LVFPLKKGSKGYGVKVIQRYMNSQCQPQLAVKGVFPLISDGDWGKNTEIAVNACRAIHTNTISKSYYNRIYRDMKAANILPKK